MNNKKKKLKKKVSCRAQRAILKAKAELTEGESGRWSDKMVT
jgi:hypothetical protein